MKALLMVLFLSLPAAALDLNSQGRPFDDTPSWTYNVDVKDQELTGPFIGRDFVSGKYRGGLAWAPLSVYRVADGQAERFAHAGLMLLSDSNKLNASFGPSVGIDFLHWTSQARYSGFLQKGFGLWKPFGLTSLAFTLDFFGGWTPLHTKGVEPWSMGVGARLIGKFGQDPATVANQIIKKGL